MAKKCPKEKITANVYKDGELFLKDAKIACVKKPIAGTYGKITHKKKTYTVSKMGSHWYL